MVVVTNDYLNYLSSAMILYQLIGVPYLNQRAREVPPCYASMTCSGLYILLTKKQIFFWIGSEFHQRYETTQLISDGLFLRLLSLYRRDVQGMTDQEAEQDSKSFEKTLSKAKVMLEGEETRRFMKVIQGKTNDEDPSESEDSEEEKDVLNESESEEEEGELLKYESPFLKRQILPQEPRLFCLIYNGAVVDFETGDDDQGVN